MAKKEAACIYSHCLFLYVFFILVVPTPDMPEHDSLIPAWVRHKNPPLHNDTYLGLLAKRSQLSGSLRTALSGMERLTACPSRSTRTPINGGLKLKTKSLPSLFLQSFISISR